MPPTKPNVSKPQFTLPLPAADFLREYWQQRPLIMRGAAGGTDFLEADRLAGLALEDEVDSRLVYSANDQYSLEQGPFDPAKFQVLPNDHWTLLVQSVDYYLTGVSLLLDSFDFLPAWRLEDIMVSYAADGGSVGPHFDHYDVFLIQTQGSKRWKIGQHCHDDTPLQPHDSLKLLSDFDTQEEYLLQAGDVLYLPPGVAHWGIAEGDDCTTWSVGFRAPDMYELLDWLLMATDGKRQPQLYRDAGRAPDQTNALSEKDINHLLQQATDTLKQLPLASHLSEWLSLPRQDTLHLLDVDCDQIRRLAPEAKYVRHGGARLLPEEASCGVVWANGDKYTIEEEARPLAKLLAKQRLVTDNELAPVLKATAAKRLLEEWLEAGYLYPL